MYIETVMPTDSSDFESEWPVTQYRKFMDELIQKRESCSADGLEQPPIPW